MVVENFPDSSDLYSEIGAITRSAKVCWGTEELAVPALRCWIFTNRFWKKAHSIKWNAHRLLPSPALEFAKMTGSCYFQWTLKIFFPSLVPCQILSYWGIKQACHGSAEPCINRYSSGWNLLSIQTIQLVWGGQKCQKKKSGLYIRHRTYSPMAPAEYLRGRSLRVGCNSS